MIWTAPGEGPIVIAAVGLTGYVVDGDPHPNVPGFLAHYDPEANFGMGDVRFVSDIADAVHFPDLPAARACWVAVPDGRPTRPDGKPNRPLTAYTVEIIRDPSAAT